MAAALTEEARKKANLRLLQRSIDSGIEDIVGNATHVVLYEYITPQGWEKSQVEGSLFLVAGSGGKQYSLAILNRHSTENFHVAVTNKFQLQHKEPYLIFKQSPKILGIWFHNANERVIMASLLNQVIENLKRSAAMVPAPAPASGSIAVPIQQQQHQQAMPPYNNNQQHGHAHQQPMSAGVPNANHVIGRTAVSPMAQQIPLQQQGATPANRQAQAAVASPSQLIEPLMNSLFVSPASTNPAMSVGGGGGGVAGAAALPGQQQERQESAIGSIAQASGGNNSNSSRSGSGHTTPTRNIPGVALDKKSLQLALLSLIQDERFIDLLHAQYLKVAHARAHRNNNNNNDNKK